MSNPVVLVTGALTGIGRATAVAFARNGSRIVVSGRHEDKGQALAGELRTLGVEAEFIRADVRNESDVRNLIDRTVERFGRLDVAVNNAGTEGELGPIVEQSAANYEATFAVNVLGTLLSLKHEMRVMLAQGSGSIINLSSVGGQVRIRGSRDLCGQQARRRGAHEECCARGRPCGRTRQRRSTRPDETQMLDRFVGRSDEAKARFVATIPSGRASTTDEIAATIVFLASDKARSLTGQSIAVDGAYTAQ